MPVFFERLLFTDGNQIPEWMVALRSLIVYIFAIAIVRAGKKRFIAGNSAFDVLVGIMLGSILSRGINGSSNFVGCIAGGVVIVFLHWLFSKLAFMFPAFEHFIKGTNSPLIVDGKIDKAALKQHHITEEDLMGALRASGHVESADHVQKAVFEQSGDISVVPKPSEPRVLDVKVEAGVQTVRISLG